MMTDIERETLELADDEMKDADDPLFLVRQAALWGMVKKLTRENEYLLEKLRVSEQEIPKRLAEIERRRKTLNSLGFGGCK